MIEVGPLTLLELKTRLRSARDQYELCSYIDHYPDVVRCRERCQHEIDRIKAEITALEAGTYTCPDCGAVSHNPNDAQHGYCARCHDFTRRALP